MATGVRAAMAFSAGWPSSNARLGRRGRLRARGRTAGRGESSRPAAPAQARPAAPAEARPAAPACEAPRKDRPPGSVWPGPSLPFSGGPMAPTRGGRRCAREARGASGPTRKARPDAAQGSGPPRRAPQPKRPPRSVPADSRNAAELASVSYGTSSSIQYAHAHTPEIAWRAVSFSRLRVGCASTIAPPTWQGTLSKEGEAPTLGKLSKARSHGAEVYAPCREEELEQKWTVSGAPTSRRSARLPMM